MRPAVASLVVLVVLAWTAPVPAVAQAPGAPEDHFLTSVPFEGADGFLTLYREAPPPPRGVHDNVPITGCTTWVEAEDAEDTTVRHAQSMRYLLRFVAISNVESLSLSVGTWNAAAGYRAAFTQGVPIPHDQVVNVVLANPAAAFPGHLVAPGDRLAVVLCTTFPFLAAGAAVLDASPYASLVGFSEAGEPYGGE